MESSCDETAAAVWDGRRMLSNVVASQTVHEKYGGVVPELASRSHHRTITGVTSQALLEADIGVSDLDAIAVTQGPGLMGSLLVGLSFAKGLSLTHRIPLYGVDHIDAHIYANFIEQTPASPLVCLTVSGGHTQLVYVEAPFSHTLLGKSRDDAAGEAFDKIGKILGLPWPGGPEIDRHSQKGDPEFHRFPRSMLNRGYEFSFSGLKTSVLYYVQEKGEGFVCEHMDNICASVSAAIVEVLISKLEMAAMEHGVGTILLAGGVSANTMLRERARQMAERMGVTLLVPRMEYCTDNAAMIAITGAMKGEVSRPDGLGLKPYARRPEG
ncbi:MAG: tRNA (adenosine(37)-N6)-threonylcarbamoyltransferase complex transferase subunit TsaD [Balneolaceae bacterium]